MMSEPRIHCSVSQTLFRITKASPLDARRKQMRCQHPNTLHSITNSSRLDARPKPKVRTPHVATPHVTSLRQCPMYAQHRIPHQIRGAYFNAGHDRQFSSRVGGPMSVPDRSYRVRAAEQGMLYLRERERNHTRVCVVEVPGSGGSLACQYQTSPIGCVRQYRTSSKDNNRMSVPDRA